jgi:hypothetical protein
MLAAPRTSTSLKHLLTMKRAVLRRIKLAPDGMNCEFLAHRRPTLFDRLTLCQSPANGSSLARELWGHRLGPLSNTRRFYADLPSSLSIPFQKLVGGDPKQPLPKTRVFRVIAMKRVHGSSPDLLDNVAELGKALPVATLGLSNVDVDGLALLCSSFYRLSHSYIMS